MHFTLEKTLATARMARIGLDDAQSQAMARELDSVIDWIAVLDEADTSGTEPLYTTAAHPLPLREDSIADGGIAPEILANAPALSNDGEFFLVPKIIEAE
ncbi:MAG: Asp-tRNA(Asn)/Glu-tRNA(Gln) amidotransferase subunit GatC [Rickettsiales bacterium]|jgi:aspartyl-tRNA(Asn)/glutamyl-tRNA(Gln) amidotransferase subunit C|nr:Asp-tRNA(Asn)/Glu-tRNA(Gln) amidotransferase subunit GatC [Rickettsiales bacterium]